VIVLRLAWRNLWRNGRRTAITLAAVGFSTAVLIVSQALMLGLVRGVIDNATNLTVGEVQVHAPEYLADRSLYRRLEAAPAVLAAARRTGVGAVARSYGSGLVAHGTQSAGAQLWGVDPADERAAFDLARHIGRGAFLPDAPGGHVVLGRKLARTLGVDVGDELVVVVQAADGSLGNEVYRIAGILKAVGETLDRSAALLHRADFAELFVTGGWVHEVALNGRGRLPLERLATLAAAAAPGADVRTWRALLPMLSDMLASISGALWVFAGIFFLAAGLGVMNTMLMATYERMREFGLLKAIGASPWRIAGDVAAESLVLAALGTFAGGAFGVGLARWLAAHGIDTTRYAGETTMMGVAFDPIWRASLSPETIVVAVACMWAVCLVAALYPAALAARLVPVEALGRV
jgi:ABC-type lipoprotein release transport system permease subunit